MIGSLSGTGGGGPQRFHIVQVFRDIGAPGAPSVAETLLLDTEDGRTWEFDFAQRQWRPVGVAAAGSASPAASAQVTQLQQLCERGCRLIRAVQSSYSWTQQEIDGFEADCRAAGVNVP